jgi:hypothetical protein
MNNEDDDVVGKNFSIDCFELFLCLIFNRLFFCGSGSGSCSIFIIILECIYLTILFVVSSLLVER